MRKLAESRLMIDDNSKPFFTPKVSFALAVTFAIGILVFLQHQQADFERTPFQDGTYSLESVSQENGQYSIDVILSEHSAVNAECAFRPLEKGEHLSVRLERGKSLLEMFKVRQRSQQSMDQSKAGSRFRRLLHENPDRRAVEGISKPKERTQ